MLPEEERSAQTNSRRQSRKDTTPTKQLRKGDNARLAHTLIYREVTSAPFLGDAASRLLLLFGTNNEVISGWWLLFGEYSAECRTKIHFVCMRRWLCGLFEKIFAGPICRVLPPKPGLAVNFVIALGTTNCALSPACV